MRVWVTIFISVFAFLAYASPAYGNDDRLFETKTPAPLDAKLTLPLKQLLSKRHDRNPVTATLQIGELTVPLSVSPRGKSRLKQCSFRPLWLEFNKTDVKGTRLNKIRKIKLVTHCKNSLKSRGLLASEMLAYRLLNLVTDHSFRIRALNVTYIDTDRDREVIHPAFVIEHKRSVAKRLDLSILKVA